MYICNIKLGILLIMRGRKSPLFINSMISKSRVEELIQERIEALGNGLFVVELNISPANVISVELDKHSGGVSIEDCMSVSRNIEHNLDREQQDFELNVSSAGLDKPFRVLAQYEKNIGRDVEVRLHEGSKFEAKLIAADTKGITVETASKVAVEGKKKKELVVEQKTFAYDEVKQTKVVISFK